MMQRYGIALWLMLCTLAWPLFGQKTVDDERQAAVDQIIELISENLESEDLDFTTLLEEINYFYDHPLNLNRATREDLRALWVLSEFQIEALLRHREFTGRFLSIYELQGVEGFDLNVIHAILPFVKVGGIGDDRTFTWDAMKKEGSIEGFVRYQRIMEDMEGYAPISDSALAESPNSRYLGSPERIYSRLRYRYLNQISAGITMEKDAGETFFGPSQPHGFDFYSAHLYVGNRGFLKQAIIGDYQAQFGQGLTYWTGLAFGKSASVSSIKRTAREITPYVSADENNFMRGAASTLSFGKIDITTFLSYKAIDANITVADTMENDAELQSEFSSFQITGLHATPSQVEDKDAIKELNTGAHVRYNHDLFEIGFTGVYTKYGGDFNRNTALYRQFEPVANEFFVAGFDYQFIYRNIMGFGENALRMDGGSATLNGLIMSLDQSLDLSLYHRHFSEGYFSPRSNAVSENTRNSNESGLYMGFEARAGVRWKLTSYYDLFQFPWLRYRTDAPSNGKEFLAQLEFKPNRAFTAYARYRIEDKYENTTIEEQATTAIDLISRQWYRLNWQYALSKTFSIRNRIELLQVRLPNGKQERGWLVYQDIIWKPQWPAKYQIKLRYALFDTESYNSRIYAYEHDVLYSFSVPAYYNRGSRAYLMFNYDLTRWSDLSIRLAQTFYANRDESGSGLNTVNGPSRTEIKAQLRVRF